MFESLFLSYFLYILYRLVAHLVMILSLSLSLSLYLDMYMHMHTHTHTLSRSRSAFDMDWAFVCFLFALSLSHWTIYSIIHSLRKKYIWTVRRLIDARPYIRQDLIYHVEVGQTPFLYFFWWLVIENQCPQLDRLPRWSICGSCWILDPVCGLNRATLPSFSESKLEGGGEIPCEYDLSWERERERMMGLTILWGRFRRVSYYASISTCDLGYASWSLPLLHGLGISKPKGTCLEWHRHFCNRRVPMASLEPSYQ